MNVSLTKVVSVDNESPAHSVQSFPLKDQASGESTGLQPGRDELSWRCS